jgi:hypothetical protein
MKIVIMVFVGIMLLVSQLLQAQGTPYLSSLDQAPTGSFAVGNDSWLATDFFTGTNAEGYLLDSVQLALTNASGSPSSFTAMIYSVVFTSGAVPGTNLATLTGSLSPISAGIYTYAPGSGLTLSPNTLYYLVLTAGTTVANGAYEWDWVYPSTSYNPNGNWEGGGYEFRSSSGSLGSWGHLGEYYPQYAITATAIPEPGVLGLLGLGGLCLLWHRRKAM